MNIRVTGRAIMFSAMASLAGCSIGGDSGMPAAIFTGSISANAPLANGTLTVTDSSTPPRNFTTSVRADGSYSINVATGVAPFLFHAQGRSGARSVELYSASPAYNGNVDISPLTSLVVANAAGKDCALSACTPPIFTAARLIDADMRVQNQLAPLLTQYGLAIADALDSKQKGAARIRKLVYFRHIAAGGYIYSHVPVEFVKDATGNWRVERNARIPASVQARKRANTFVPIAGAPSLGQWLPFSKESFTYPYGATLIIVRTAGGSPVTLEYSRGESGAIRVAGAAMVEAVTGTSFLPACPRPPGQPGSCIKVRELGNGEYTAAFSERDATVEEPPFNSSAKAPGI